MNPKKLLVFAFWLAVCAAFATVSLFAQGNRDQVKGTYYTTGSNVCIVSSTPSPPDQFNVNLTPVDGTYIQSSSVQGILQINADGTGTGQFDEYIVTYPGAAHPGGGSSAYPVSFTYSFADDGTLTVEFAQINGTLLTGALAGYKFSVSPPPLSGRIARDGGTMLLSNTGPTVETLTISPAPNHFFSFQRICHRTRVLIAIHVDGQN